VSTRAVNRTRRAAVDRVARYGRDPLPTEGSIGSAERADEQWDPDEDDGVLDASDTLEGGVADPLDIGVAAADRWAGADRFGTTAAEQHAGESLEQLLAEEEPDPDPYADDPYDEDELTRRGYDREPRAGRLVAGDEGLDADGGAYDVGIDGGGAGAEEAAMHVVVDPDGPGDGPLR
jgi:Family of unknown function (DUF5709)